MEAKTSRPAGPRYPTCRLRPFPFCRRVHGSTVDLLAHSLSSFFLPLQARDEAVFEKAYGKDLFNRDAPSYMEEGTRENPIPILSTHAERVVGISLPDEAETRWFTLRKGELCYDPDTMNFFALKQVSQDEVNAWVSAAEKKVLGGK